MWSLATETPQGLSNGTEVLPGTIDPQYNAGFVWTRQYGFRVTKDFSKKFFLGASARERRNPQSRPVQNLPDKSADRLCGQRRWSLQPPPPTTPSTLLLTSSPSCI